MLNRSLVSSDIPSGGSIPEALEEIRNVLSTSSESDEARGIILEFTKTHDDALYRTCLDGHLTGSALIVENSREKILVMLHKKLNIWLQPGGHADGEGYLCNVSYREAFEETGIKNLTLSTPAIDCDVHRIPKFGDEEEHYHFDVTYLLLAPETAKIKRNHESTDMRWVTLEQLEMLTKEERLLRLARVGLKLAHEVKT
tara:strand:- start:79 stop:675 length:597 start_codon:yes stop_codon:yes gene_type:complete